MRNLLFVFLFVVGITCNGFGQWQQRVKYVMDVNLDVQTNIIKGKQSVEYYNNSPDTLKVIYYHLYWNAFQPESMMDVRNRELGKRLLFGRPDWEARVADRIQKLQPNEIGYQKVSNLKMNGRQQQTELFETILKVMLDKPILPGTKVLLEADFEAQVPVQIRRSGRDNAEGVRYSMSQWYPKIAEYDREGWHPTPYIAREFYGIWGDFDVNITLDKNYVIGGTGYLQNPLEIGYGYEPIGAKVVRKAGDLLTWKFKAPNVHDFVWAADPEYRHISKKVRDGMVLNAFFKISIPALTKYFDAQSPNFKKRFNNNAANYIQFYEKEWQDVLELAAKALPFMDKTFGKYPYKQYTFLQGGDGGMEYPMATLLKGAGEDVVLHEWMHSWYQMMMGTNESLYYWMDEGFTTYAENRIKAWLHNDTTWAQDDSYAGYFGLVKSGVEEPLTTHADQFETRYGHVTSAYSKGAVFMEQLGYIIGESNRDKVLLEYFNKWRFKHPNAVDFLRVAEEVSGIQLDWYRTYFLNTTKTIDYGIDSLWQVGNKINIKVKRNGLVPMPIDVVLQFNDGSKKMAYIPQYLMFATKPAEDSTPRTVFAPWRWTHPFYTFEIDGDLRTLKSIEIDPSHRMADVERKNNKLELKWN